MIHEHIGGLIQTYSDIKEIWLIGSRAEGNPRQNSDWDYLIFANHRVLRALRQKKYFNLPSTDLLIVYDGDRFEKPWREGTVRKGGSLTGWGWKRVSATEATYKAAKFSDDGDFFHVGRAKRVWPFSEVGIDG